MYMFVCMCVHFSESPVTVPPPSALRGVDDTKDTKQDPGCDGREGRVVCVCGGGWGAIGAPSALHHSAPLQLYKIGF